MSQWIMRQVEVSRPIPEAFRLTITCSDPLMGTGPKVPVRRFVMWTSIIGCGATAEILRRVADYLDAGRESEEPK
jgi:hypothetical protein